jgi:hypothetical protein
MGNSSHHRQLVQVASRQEDYLSSQTLSETELRNNTCEQQTQYPFVVYIVCDQLKTGMGNALIDTGSQVSLVAENSLKRKGLKFSDQVIEIYGITGNVMQTKGQVELSVGETSPHEFMVIQELPMDCDLVIGQDWLGRFGYHFSIPSLGIDLPAYSETIVRIPTNEKGVRLIESQELQQNVFCASSIVDCADSSFTCLIINCNPTNETLKTFPKLQEMPKLNSKFTEASKREENTRIQLLQTQLRLAHLKEGEQDIRQICGEYVDIFKLPGDRLTTTSTIEHHIPTPTSPVNRAITLRNYRIPEHQAEVNNQIRQMLEDKIIQHSHSPWNFPILIVPKKLDASGRRKWRICVDFRKLNEVTVGDSFPLPNIQEILDKLGRARYFSALDCASGYHQVPLTEEDRVKTAFSTATGHYEYLRMPFGLKSAPSTFQ